MAIVLQKHLSWPYALEHVAIALDGQLQYVKRGQIPSEVLIASFDRLPTGEHTASVRATLRYASGTLGQDCSITLRASHTLVLGEAPARMMIDVHTTGVTEDFLSRVHLTFRETGTVRATEVYGASVGPGRAIRSKQVEEQQEEDLACATVADVEGALCRAELRLALARRDKDIIKVLCINDKHVQMKVLSRIILERKQEEEAARASGDSTAAEHAAAVQQVARQKVAELLDQVHNCMCEYPAYFPSGPEYVLELPACQGRGSVGPVERFPDPL